MAEDIGGVWRTIGGRRVFIKTGQSLSQAMKASGKFKTAGKKKKEPTNETEKMLSNLKEQAGQKGAYGKAETNIDENYKVSYNQMASGDLYEIKDKDGNIARSRDGKNWETHIKGKWSDKDNMSYDEAMKTLKSQGGEESALDRSTKALDRIENLARENKDLPGWSEERLIKKGKQMGSKDFEKWIANEKQNAGTAGAKTNGLQEGIPYKVKMGKGIEKQSIYLGKDENGRHVFYDGEGVTGKYAFSEDFIKKNNIQFDKDNNDPVKVNKLTQELKKSGAKEYDVDMSNTTTKEYNKKSAEVGYPRNDEKGNYRIEKNGEYQYKMYESLKDLEPKSEKAKSTNDTMNIAIRYNKTIQTLMKKGMSRQEALEYIKKNLIK